MITMDAKELATALKIVKSSAEKGTLNPILNTVHIKTVSGGVELTCTDINNVARTVVEANVVKDVDVCVNVDKLDCIVSRLDSLVQLIVDENLLLVKSGKTVFKLLFMNSNDFPYIEFNTDGEKINLNKEDLSLAVNQTAFATMSADQRNVLSGICLSISDNDFEFASTDGNRLSRKVFEGKIGKTGKYIVPSKVLSDFVKSALDDIEIYFSDKNIILKSGNVMFRSALINGTYPQYQALIPKSTENKITFNKSDLLKSLEKVTILMDERTNIINLNFENKTLTITSHTQEEEAKDVIDVDYDGELKINFNGKYLIDGIKAMKTDKFVMGVNNNTSAVMFESDYTYLLMPMKV